MIQAEELVLLVFSVSFVFLHWPRILQFLYQKKVLNIEKSESTFAEQYLFAFLVFSRLGVLFTFELRELKAAIAFEKTYLFYNVILLALVYLFIWLFLVFSKFF